MGGVDGADRDDDLEGMADLYGDAVGDDGDDDAESWGLREWRIRTLRLRSTTLLLRYELGSLDQFSPANLSWE